MVARLAWMRDEAIWPNGMRYLWTDGFGVVLLVSLAEALGRDQYLDEAERVVADVDAVLRRPRGYRIGEAGDRYGQYFHYLTIWAFALGVLGDHREGYRDRGIDLVREVHAPFLSSGRGIWWKMREDLSGPETGFGLGALDPFQALAVYRSLDRGSGRLATEIGEIRELIGKMTAELVVTQDLGIGMILWASSRCAGESWAETHRLRGLAVLADMWIDPPGYFCREPGQHDVRFAFTNYGVALGLHAAHPGDARITPLIRHFDAYRSHDHYDRDAITHVMGCVARLPGRFLT